MKERYAVEVITIDVDGTLDTRIAAAFTTRARANALAVKLERAIGREPLYTSVDADVRVVPLSQPTIKGMLG